MAQLTRRGWHGRIRLKSSVWSYRGGARPWKAARLARARGDARGWHHVYLTQGHEGPVHLAVARRQEGKAAWLVVSDAPTA